MLCFLSERKVWWDSVAGENRMKKRKSQIRHDVTEQEEETLRKNV